MVDIYLLLNSGSTGAYHSIMYGDFSILIAGINILLSLLTNFNRTDKVLLALSALSALSASLIVGANKSLTSGSRWLFFVAIFIVNKLSGIGNCSIKFINCLTGKDTNSDIPLLTLKLNMLISYWETLLFTFKINAYGTDKHIGYF
jgi:hypothetical protein